MTTRKKIITSPCVGMCDVFDKVCTGCFRDINEISDWYDMNDDEKRKLLGELEQRRKKAEALKLK